jgi:serine phosphatase RsbU (regulator of sigma subunit)
MDGGRTATVRARTRARLLKMGQAAFRDLLNRQPDLGFEVARQLALRLRHSDTAIIGDLKEKNRQLLAAYTQLQAAQAQLIEKEKLERELQVARQIQESILPKTLPVIPGVTSGVVMCPARAVGGDLYDLICLENNCLGVVIGDVSDKGVPAAIFMALSRSLLRAEASRISSPAAVLREVNRHLMDMNTAGLFVTAIYGVLDPAARRFTFARAGHEYPLIFCPDGTPLALKSCHGQALGLFETVALEEQSVTLPPGGLLVLYTDGATDAFNPEGERFGRDRLREAVQQRMCRPAQAICQAVLDLIVQFQCGTPQFDDVVLLAIAVA